MNTLVMAGLVPAILDLEKLSLSASRSPGQAQ
jgi:hypothetical protein